MELLVKGKMLGEAAKLFSQAHHFERFNYTMPTYCDCCQEMLWGFSKTGELELWGLVTELLNMITELLSMITELLIMITELLSMITELLSMITEL